MLLEGQSYKLFCLLKVHLGEKLPMIEQIPRTQWPHCAWDQTSQKSMEKQIWVCIRIKRSYMTVNVEKNNTSDKKISLKQVSNFGYCKYST